MRFASVARGGDFSMIRNYSHRLFESRSYLSRGRDKIFSPCKPGPVDTLANRIQWILENCRDPSGEHWSAKGLSLAAGTSPGYVAILARGEVINPGKDTLGKIARAARVSYRWLAFGLGLPSDEDAGPAEDGQERIQPALSEQPNYSEVLHTAKIMAPEIESWAWTRVGEWNVTLIVPLNAGILIELARIVMRYEPPPKRSNPQKG
jgi:transcriptional regulator with XRE-family HTH domain